MQETVLELFENLGRAMTVASSVVLRVDWVNNNEDSLALGSLGVERPTTSKYKIFALIPPNYSNRSHFISPLCWRQKEPL